MTTVRDEKVVIVGSQQSQSGYNALQLPYCYKGVGRSNNYIENFFLGMSIGAQRTIYTKSPFIPNSQLVIFAKSSDILTWNIEQFINPTASLFIIIIACLICLLGIGIVIIVLHCKEKIEDDRAKDPNFAYF